MVVKFKRPFLKPFKNQGGVVVKGIRLEIRRLSSYLVVDTKPAK